MTSAGASDKGLVRKINQDSFKIVEDENVTLGVVCDGIGGNRAGEVASALSCDIMEAYYHNNYQKGETAGGKWIKRAFDIANIAVFKKNQEDEKYKGMGTTMVAFIANQEETFVANVGDSRCYAIDNDNQMIQISQDHTLVNDLINIRGLSYQEATQIVGKNVISRAIGIGQQTKVDVFRLSNDYQYLLLCSDGLHGYVEEEAIRQELISSASLPEKCQHLIEMANAAGGYDNIAVVIYQR